MTSCSTQLTQKTIFDLLDQYGISWKYYRDSENYIKNFVSLRTKDGKKMVGGGQFKKDVKKGRLPQVAFVESSEWMLEDEHPSSDIQIGQQWVSKRIRYLLKSRYWKN